MKIYVIMAGAWEMQHVVAATLDEKKAEAIRENCEKQAKTFSSLAEPYIAEFDTETADKLAEGYRGFAFYFRPDGVLNSCLPSGGTEKLLSFSKNEILVRVLAKDAKSGEEIARNRFEQWKSGKDM